MKGGLFDPQWRGDASVQETECVRYLEIAWTFRRSKLCGTVDTRKRRKSYIPDRTTAACETLPDTLHG